MLKTNKRGFVQFLFNPFILLIITIAVIVFIFFSKSSGLLSITPLSSVSFAGFEWDTEINNHHFAGGCTGSVIGGETANLNIQVSGSSGGAACDVTMITRTQINSIDEFLVIFDSTQYAGFEMGSSAGVFITDKTRYSTQAETNVISRVLNYEDSISGGKSSFSQYFSPKIIKLKNNFDGTYSVLTSLGVGDVFIVKTTAPIPKDKPLYLGLVVNGGGGAGGNDARSSMIVYNIGRKENAFAVCKADQFVQDVNNDGKIAGDGSECFDLNTLVLNSEEFVKESDFVKQQRLLEELQAKNSGLTTDISLLKQQLAQQPAAFDSTALEQKIALLESELKTAKSTLADVQAGDKNVINTITQQEQFEKPSTIKNFFNRIIAWIKGLFQ